MECPNCGHVLREDDLGRDCSSHDDGYYDPQDYEDGAFADDFDDFSVEDDFGDVRSYADDFDDE